MKSPLLFASLLAASLATSQMVDPRLQPAESLFAQGRFEQAKGIYTQAYGRDNNDPHVLQKLGQIALYENRFHEAEAYLRKLIEVDPTNLAAKSLLAQTYYRQDRFNEEVPLLRALKRDAEADEFEELAAKPAYQTPSAFKRTEIKFVQVDPLPIVEVSVNGTAPVRFFVDTGASEITIDKDFAAHLGLRSTGGDTGTFAGGKQAVLKNTIIDSLDFNGFTVKNVPATTLDLSQVGRVLGGKVDGCIGTVFLYHFLSTIDYPHQRLILRPKNGRFDEKGKTVRIPFWMAGDHIMLAWAHLNSAPEHLFFIDTGLAGAALNAPKATLDEAGITLDSKTSVGVGGGGDVQFSSFTVDSITLGPIKGRNLPGVYDGEFMSAKPGALQIAGLISHAFFKPYELTFDFRHMELLLTSPIGR